jgi:2-succinyl-5-enolpyruvyl-6-hydroxy-3-cyclohexene-1-carboxylate synthase
MFICIKKYKFKFYLSKQLRNRIYKPFSFIRNIIDIRTQNHHTNKKKMYTNNLQILHLISLLKQFGINKVVISPGSRHYPLTHSLEADDYFQLYSVVDERSAAFFALGMIQECGEPVAICCSSGTASVNYSSAVCEAFYQKLPLLVITIDRLSAFLGQTEDQMIMQTNIYKGFINYECSLSMNNNAIDHWHSNRIINEALIHLSKKEKGPVHINIPIEQHHAAKFDTKLLPVVRRIFHHNPEMYANQWNDLAQYLSNKKIIIIWGQSEPIPEELNQILDRLTSVINFVILTDNISNCKQKHAIVNTFTTLRAMSVQDQTDLAPDVVLSIGANFVFNLEIKGFLGAYKDELENWQINTGGEISDPYKRLTRVFEMSPLFFFRKVAEYSTPENNKDTYFNEWLALANEVIEPDVPFSQLNMIGKLIKKLPKNSVLQIANSNAIRLAHLFSIDESIKCYCNRGVNGIDGCMSTAVGFAANSEKPVFYITGDLTFFYDMNAIWNRHLSKNFRILLINNEGGAVMHMPFAKENARELEKHTSAAHYISAKGWAESLGFSYVSVRSEEEADNAIASLTAIEIEGPVLVEVFTKKEEDVEIVKQYYALLNKVTTVDRAKRKALRIAKRFLK